MCASGALRVEREWVTAVNGATAVIWGFGGATWREPRGVPWASGSASWRAALSRLKQSLAATVGDLNERASDGAGFVAAHRWLVSHWRGDMETSLHEAAQNGDLAVVRSLLASGVDVEAKTADGANKTPLHLAAANGHAEAMWVLVQFGADTEAKGVLGETPLHLAAAYGHVEAIRVMLQQGANNEAKTADGETPLHLAAADGHVEAIREMVPAPCRLLRQVDWRLSLSCFRLLDTKGVIGMTALHLAAGGGHVEAIRVLLLLGANRDAKDDNGVQPLHLAAARGQREAMLTLTEQGGSELTPLQLEQLVDTDALVQFAISESHESHLRQVEGVFVFATLCVVLVLLLALFW